MGSRTELLREIIEEVNKEVKYTAASLASDGMLSDVPAFIPTGSTLLDLVLRGGVPVGRIVEIYGREGSGKTTLCTHIMANAQKMGGTAVFIDSEAAFFKNRAAKLGVDLSELIELGADTIEQGFSLIFKILAKLRASQQQDDSPVVVVWDTIASAQTESDRSKQGEIGGGMMEKPRIIRAAMRSISRVLPRERAALVFVNQVMATPTGDTTPGGLGIKFHASQRIGLKRLGQLQDSEGVYGIEVAARVTKNKLDGALTKTDTVTIPINFDSGIDDPRSIVEFLIESGCKDVRRSGSWTKVTLNGKDRSFYMKDLDKFIAENEEMLPFLKEKAKEVIRVQEE